MRFRLLFLLFTICTALAPSAIAQTYQSAMADLSQVARIQVHKSERRLYLLDHNGNAIRSYPVALGKNPVGRKQKEGDNRTPEGRYVINGRNEKSHYFLSLRISYPGPEDIDRAERMGYDPGGDIFIHGLPNDRSGPLQRYRAYWTDTDWTNGCIAVSNAAMQEIWNLVQDGTPIIITP